VHPGQSDVTSTFLDGFARHLSEAAIGTIGEVFDAETPHAPRACISQAWSVAEVLRLTLLLNREQNVDHCRELEADSPNYVDDQELLRTSR
jgi:glycogen debranching enzyme